MLDKLMIIVNLIQDSICIGFFTGSKSDNFEMKGSSFQETDGIWPNRDIAFLSTAIV